MGRILAIDFGGKRTGLAATDPLQIIVSGIGAYKTTEVIAEIEDYIGRESVEKIVVGYPFFDEEFNHLFKKRLDGFIRTMREKFPEIPVDLHDESFTSAKAKQVIMDSGAKQKTRRDKSLVDKVSAVIILQEYLGHI